MQELDARLAVRDLVARHAAGFAVNFAGTLFIARTLGPDVWGTYFVAFVLLAIAQGVIERGTAGYLTSRRDPAGAAATALVVQAVVGALTLAVIVLAATPASAAYGRPLLVPLLVGAGVSAFAYALRAVPLGLLEHRLRYRDVALVEVGELVVFNGVAVAGVAIGSGLEGLVLATMLRGPASALIAWLVARPQLRVRPSLAAARELGGFVVPYSGANALGWVNLAAAPVIVGRIAGTDQLGLLQMAYTLVLYPQIITTVIGRVAFPVYSRSATLGDVRGDVERSTAAIMRFAGSLMLGVAIVSPLWVPALFGTAWMGMVPIITTVAAPLGVSMGFVALLAGLNARRFVGRAFVVGAMYSLCYWGLGALLVPLFGAIGLTVAQAISLATYLGYLWAFERAFGRIRIAPILARYAIAAGGLVASALISTSGAPSQLTLPVAALAMSVLVRPSDLSSIVVAARALLPRFGRMRAH